MRDTALCVMYGALVIAKFQKHHPTFVNALGGIGNRPPPTCPQCKKAKEFTSDDDGWLSCAEGCGFRILKSHHEQILEYFNSPQHDVAEYVREYRTTWVSQVSFGEDTETESE